MIDVKVGDRVYLMTGGGEKASVDLLRPLSLYSLLSLCSRSLSLPLDPSLARSRSLALYLESCWYFSFVVL